jgi:hypothetical protein
VDGTAADRPGGRKSPAVAVAVRLTRPAGENEPDRPLLLEPAYYAALRGQWRY